MYVNVFLYIYIYIYACMYVSMSVCWLQTNFKPVSDP